MGILSLSGDQLKYDPLKEDSLKNAYDPMSKAAGKRVQTYDKELGYAVHPEEKAYATYLKGAVDEQANKQQGAISNYQSQYNSAMSEAEKQASGILSTAQGQVDGIKRQNIDTIPVNIVSPDGNSIEGTYNVPRSVAEKLAEEKELVSRWNEDGSFNLSVRSRHGKMLGQELHEEFSKAVATLGEYEQMNDEAYDTAKQAGEMQVDSLKSEIDTQRNIATGAYNQNISFANQNLAQIQAQWTNFVTGRQQAFQEGLKTNTGGIADLVKSGALVLKGSPA